MAPTAGLSILGLVLASWIARTSFAQSLRGCEFFGHLQTVIASEFYNTTVTSPNYPSDYDNNLECRLLIKVDNNLLFRGYIVKVIFSDFQLESPCTPLIGDVLKFYDGMNALSSLLGSYCGTIHPDVIYSTGQYLYIKFHTDRFSTYKGFKFSFSAVKKEEASGICRPSDGSSKHNLIGSSGEFFTPDYPVPYPNDATCIWIITVPVRKRVKLKFAELHLDTAFGSCTQVNTKDYVQIRDGQDQESKELALLCGYNLYSSSEVFSTGRYMWVKFHSNFQSSWLQAKGFKAHFEAVDLLPSKEMCFTGNIFNNNLTLSGSYGTLQSPQDPKYYPPGSSCDWLITVPEGKIVKLGFDRFELKPSYGTICTVDYVEILDGHSSYSKSKGKFCGYTKPEGIRSSGRYMLLRFRADLSTGKYYRGFNATFTAEDKPSKSSKLALIIGVTVGVVVFIVLVCCIVFIAKHKKTPTGAAGVGMPMTGTTSASHATQPGVIQHPPPNPIQQQPAVNPYAPPPVGYAPFTSNLSSPPPAYPYSSERPPPYPGKETVSQYPLPGQPYPWLQSVPASAPPQSP